MKWQGYLIDNAIEDVKNILSSMEGYSIPWSDYQPIVGSSFSWIWMNLQDFVWRNFKQKAIWSYNLDFLACTLLEFSDNDFKFVGLVKEVGAL
jgi:hypothetical protein